MKIYIYVRQDNVIDGWGTSKETGGIEVEIEETHPLLNDLPRNYLYIDGSIIRNDELILYKTRHNKIDELDQSCNDCILGKFTATIDGVQYQFSNSQSAQGNFDKMYRAFEKGYLTGLNWTAYDMEGNVVRVPINASKMEALYIAHLTHIESSISKFRDVLQPLVEKATTIEEIESIKW